MKKIIRRLDSVINAFGESADSYYYAGVKALFDNDGLAAEYAFDIALLLGYHDRDKIDQHLANLKYRK